MACPLFCKPLGRAQAETAQSAGNQISRVVGQRQNVLVVCRVIRMVSALYAVAISDDDLADLPRLLHIAECAHDVVGIEFLVRQRMQSTLSEQIHYLAKETA